MLKEDKAKVLEELKEKFQQNSVFYVADAQGMSVDKVNAFRKLCYSKGIEYKVYKNSLIAKVLKELDPAFEDFNTKVLKGFSGILFSGESPKECALLLKEFRKGDSKMPLLKGASIDKAFYFGDDSLEALSNFKSKNELIGEIVGLLQSPAKNVVSALQSAPNKLAGIVKTLSEK